MNYRQKFGKFGEDLAVAFLKRHGYKITKRNARIGNKEVDIIANIKDKLVFVEVKTVSSSAGGSAEDCIGRRKINHLLSALKVHTEKYNLNPDNARLDLIIIDINKVNKSANIKHYKDIY